MREKPFIRLPIYWIERSKWNPLRYIFGKDRLTSDISKWHKQLKLDVSDITFVTNANVDSAPNPITSDSSSSEKI